MAPKRILEDVVYAHQEHRPTGCSIRTRAADCDAKGTTVDQLATKAIERDLARRWLDRVGREGDLRRGDMSDADVEAAVERAVQESRRRS
jgi:hypothetical protein